MVQVLSQIYFLLISISVVFAAVSYLCSASTCYGVKNLCLAQVTLFITYISIAYTFHAGEAENYFRRLSSFALPCYIIYILNNAIQGLLPIWRIYILYGDNIKICIPLIILLALQVGFAGATAKGAATRNVNRDQLRVFNLITWSLIVVVNVSATLLISLRLCSARQNARDIPSVSKYKSTILVVVECGALVTICTLAMLILHAVRRPVGIAGLGITTQAATMVPLLIVARYGILNRKAERRAFATQIPLRISVVRTEDMCVDTPMEFGLQNRSMRSDPPLSHFPSGDHPKPFFDA